MKFLRCFLFFTYVVVIALLLLNNCKSCTHSPKDTEEEDDDEEFIDTVAPPRHTEQPDTIPTNDVIRRSEEAGQTGELQVTLLWDYIADLDLHIQQPNGVELWYNNKRDPSTGGELDRDCRPGGTGSAENAYWTTPPAGEYVIAIDYYDNSNPENTAGTCTVRIHQEGKPDKIKRVQMTYPGQQEIIDNIIVE